MALNIFKKEKKTAKPKASKKKEVVPSSAPEVKKEAGVNTASFAHVLKSPRITEKAALMGEQNAYTFNVAADANKVQIAKAFEAMYKFKPVKVRVSNLKPELIWRGGRFGTTKNEKKAVVYLKKGDKIELM